MRPIPVIVLALAAAACSPSARDEDGPRPLHADSRLSPAERSASALTSEFLVGYWDHDRACRSGAGTSLWPDGRYSMNNGSGRWSLAGNRLTIVQRKPASVPIFQVRLGEPGRSRVEVIGPNTISVSWDGGGEARFYLCAPG